LIDPSALRAAKALSFLIPMAQSRLGVAQIMEVKTHPLVGVIPRFIQLVVLLQLLKQMVQSPLGVIQIGVAKKVHPRAMVILRFPQRFPPLPPLGLMAQLQLGVKSVRL
jgi:hypothetical protein